MTSLLKAKDKQMMEIKGIAASRRT